MKHSTNKLFAAAALLACFACAKTETDIDKVVKENEPGVYVHFAPIIEDDAPATRGYAKSNWSYNVEVGDQINIWSAAASLQIFKVVETQTGPKGNFVAKIESSGFGLNDGEEYYSTYPFVLNNVVHDHKSQVYTYEGQNQTDQNGTQLRDLGKYMYSWAKATSENGKANFSFEHFSTFFRVTATLPEANMTIKEIAVTANKDVFDLNGTFDLTTGTLIPDGNYTSTIKMSLNNLTVNGNVITAYFASNPLEAANYVITVTDSNNKVYKSIEVAKGARAAGKATAFIVDVVPEGGYVKLTSMPSDPAGKYILVYPNGTTYRAFSFAKTMENAETAAASVSTVAFADLYNQSSDLYNTVVGGNYVEITGEANATTLTLTDEQEAAAAITIAANANPWTVTAPAVDLQTTFTSGSYSMRVDHLVANVSSDGKADLVAAFNAPDGVAIMNSLRGHNVSVTFDDLIKLALAKTDGFDATPNSIDDQFVRKAFTKLVAVAHEIVEDNPHNLFPAGSSLMSIDFSTNALDVFKQYHDNVADLSWRMSPEKKFGLAQLGYNVNANGFTAQVDLPSYEWFYKLNESLVQSTIPVSIMGMITFDLPNREEFVNYWKAIDSQYTVNIDGSKIDNFFEKLATRLIEELNEVPLPDLNNPMALMSWYRSKEYENDEFYQLYYAAAPEYGGEKFKKVGDAYKTLAEKLNTGIQPAYIYKKVE